MYVYIIGNIFVNTLSIVKNPALKRYVFNVYIEKHNYNFQVMKVNKGHNRLPQ